MSPLSDMFPANHGNYFRTCKYQRKGELSCASGTISLCDKNDRAWLRIDFFIYYVYNIFTYKSYSFKNMEYFRNKRGFRIYYIIFNIIFLIKLCFIERKLRVKIFKNHRNIFFFQSNLKIISCFCIMSCISLLQAWRYLLQLSHFATISRANHL